MYQNKEDNTIKFKDGMKILEEKGYFEPISKEELLELIASVKPIGPEDGKED